MSDKNPDSSSLPKEGTEASDLSSLAADPVFGGLLATQLLGAFNDNFFKQLVLLQCTALAVAGSANMQPLALAAFALPFVLISGFAGFLSDRYSKRRIIVLCKVGEILVMTAALAALLLGRTSEGQLKLLIVVLAFMAAQSAFFGPSKYGILPELFKGKRLLPVNGAIQMTTFLAIIFGTAAAGIALDNLNESLWLCSVIAIVIGMIGTLTSLLVAPTPVAQPGLKFEPGNLFVPRDVREFLKQQPKLFKALLVISLFWFIGGVAHPAVNNLGDLTFSMSKTRTSLMAASIGVGIAVGCVISGFVNTGRTGGHRWTTRGSWMIVASLLLITLLGSGVFGLPAETVNSGHGVLRSMADADLTEWSLRVAMFSLGFAAGMFVIPIQVYIQQEPPAKQKGRLIGTMNLMTWLGLLVSSAFLLAMQKLIIAVYGPSEADANQHLTFLALAFLMMPVALFYRLPVSSPRSTVSESN